MATPASDPHRISRARKIDPAKRLGYSALQYLVSPKEYELVRSKLPPQYRRLTITRAEMDEATGAKESRMFVRSSARGAVRVFLTLQTAMAVMDFVVRKVRRGAVVPAQKGGGMSANTRLSLSAGTIVFVYRLLYRFFTRLRVGIQKPSSAEFREKHPRVYKIISSRLAPCVGPALAGLALAIHPADSRRVTVAVYALTRALEYVYNGAELSGALKNKPWWFGSWLLFPLTTAQLLHAFVFDRDCFPESYEKLIMAYSNEYIQPRPEDLPAELIWPRTSDIIDGVGTIAKLRYPPFESPIIVPSATLPPALSKVAPIISPAHPLLPSLHCALVHPHNRSCGKTYLSQFLSIFPRASKLLFILYTLCALPKFKKLLADPSRAFTNIGLKTLRTATFFSGTLATAWSSLCFFQKTLPRTLLPESRFYLAGLLGGLWAFIDRESNRSNFAYAFRVALLSCWQTGVKRKWWKGVKNGDVLLFTAALAVVGVVHEWRREALDGAGRWVVKGLRGSQAEEAAEGRRVGGEEKRD